MQIKPDAKEKAQKAKSLTATILENLAKRQPIKPEELKAEEVFRGLSEEEKASGHDPHHDESHQYLHESFNGEFRCTDLGLKTKSTLKGLSEEEK